MRAVLCGYYGKGNAGDEALLATLLQMLPGEIQPLILSANPRETENLHKTQATDRLSVLNLIKTLKQSDLFIWGGGSLMQDTTSLRNPIYYGGLMGLAQGLGLKTVAWAQGIGPLHHGLSRWIAAKAFSKCTRVSVRDSGSAQMLLDWRVDAVLAPDPVWALESKSGSKSGTESGARSKTSTAPRIAIMLRSHPRLTPSRLNCLIQALINLQKSTGAFLLLIPFQPSHDGEIASKIQIALGGKSGQSAVINESNPAALKGIFKNVDLAIAMRYHGLIMAASEGCRCVAISYDPKVSRLMSELNLAGWELADLPDNPQTISDLWLEQLSSGAPLEFDQINKIVERALVHRQILLNL